MITLEVTVCQQDGQQLRFQVYPHTILSKVFQRVSLAWSIDAKDMNLMADGHILTYHKTVDEAGLESDDIIDMIMTQAGD